MSAVQTFVKKEKKEKFRNFMERHGLTPYKAGAELIELGLEFDEQRRRLGKANEDTAKGEPRPDRKEPSGTKGVPPFVKPRGE